MANTISQATTATSGFAAATTAITSLANLVLVTPQATKGYQPQNPPDPYTGLPGFGQQPPAILFHYEGEQTVTLESDITDHYIEDNTAIQDQISLKPVTITTHGFIGELNDIPPKALQFVQTAANKLLAIEAYTPELTETALIAYNEAFLAYQITTNAISAAVSAISSLSGTAGESVINGNSITPQANQSKQQIAFQLFWGYWQTRTMFTIQTPWAVFQNMAILRLRSIQDETTNTITDFEVVFKQIRTATTAVVLGLPAALLGRAAAQAASVINNGPVALNSGNTSQVAAVASVISGPLGGL